MGVVGWNIRHRDGGGFGQVERDKEKGLGEGGMFLRFFIFLWWVEELVFSKCWMGFFEGIYGDGLRDEHWNWRMRKSRFIY